VLKSGKKGSRGRKKKKTVKIKSCERGKKICSSVATNQKCYKGKGGGGGSQRGSAGKTKGKGRNVEVPSGGDASKKKAEENEWPNRFPKKRGKHGEGGGRGGPEATQLFMVRCNENDGVETVLGKHGGLLKGPVTLT